MPSRDCGSCFDIFIDAIRRTTHPASISYSPVLPVVPTPDFDAASTDLYPRAGYADECTARNPRAGTRAEPVLAAGPLARHSHQSRRRRAPQRGVGR